MYEYFLWCVLLGVVWVVLYAARPDLRQKLLWSSLVAMPFGFIEMFFYPNYWHPQTLFGIAERYNVAIESFLVMFFLGGLAAGAYESFFRKHVPVVRRQCHPFCRCLPLITAITALMFFTKQFPEWPAIAHAISSLLIASAFAIVLFPELRRHILTGGIAFAVVYWASLALMDLLTQGWIARTWNPAVVSGFTLLHVPLEEILFGFSFGAFWTSMYEEACARLR